MLPFVFKLSPASLAANDAVEHATKNCPFTVSDSVHGMLSPVELEAMSARMAANADEWLARKIKPPVVKAPKAAKAVRRPPKVVANPFAGYLMNLDDFGRSYPLFAMDMAVSRNKCNSQLIFLSMLITKLGIPASETSLPLGV